MSYNSYMLLNFRRRTNEEVESDKDSFVKGLRQQRDTTTGQPALKKRR
jgi:hypothetical protein